MGLFRQAARTDWRWPTATVWAIRCGPVTSGADRVRARSPMVRCLVEEGRHSRMTSPADRTEW